MIALQPNNSGVRVTEGPGTAPCYLELGLAIWVGTGNECIGRHPIVRMRRALFGC
jgi:hypothetical protein